MTFASILLRIKNKLKDLYKHFQLLWQKEILSQQISPAMCEKVVELTSNVIEDMSTEIKVIYEDKELYRQLSNEYNYSISDIKLAKNHLDIN